MIHNPHDKFFRAALSDQRVAKAFFDFHLPPFIKKAVDLNTLQLRKDSYVDEQLKLAITDMLFSVSLHNQPGYLYTLVEHQRKPDKLMPFRLLKYTVAIMEQHLKTTQGQALPVVYPLLFYTGEAAYPYSTDLFELFDDPEGLAKQTFLKPFQLVDVSQIPDEALKQDVWRGVMELCMKHVFERDILPFLHNVISLLQQAEQKGGAGYVQAALTYLFTTGEVTSSEAFLETVQAHLTPETGASIMTIAQQIEAKGEAKGRTEGHLAGETEAKKTIAYKLLKQGIPLETVGELTELPDFEVRALSEKLQAN